VLAWVLAEPQQTSGGELPAGGFSLPACGQPARTHRNEGSSGMKGQSLVFVYGDGGEQLTVLDGSVTEASFDILGFIENIGTLIYDYFADKTSLQKDAESALKKLGGDVKAQGQQQVSIAQGGGLYTGETRAAAYAIVLFHAWTGDDIKPSTGKCEPASPGILDLGSVRYTRGDFQYEYRFLFRFGLLGAGKYAMAFATGDSGTVQDATIGYVIELTIDPPAQPLQTIQVKHDAMVEHGWFNFGPQKTAVTIRPDGGSFQDFENGSLYFSPGRGAHLVFGAIRDKWLALGGADGLGYPLTDELGAADGTGRFNHFQAGSVYWTPQLGAHAVLGGIREKWASLGWERSYLGYPVTDEGDDPSCKGGRYVNFDGGCIRWSAQTGARDYHQRCPGT
jgi:hypothetical protein